MRKYGMFLAISLLIALVASVSCGPQPTLEVALDSPGNGGSVSSLTPILAWTCTETNALYRLQVATDSNFQNLLIDESNLTGPSYAIPSGKLSDKQSYYWRVSASKDNQASGWTSYWSFQTALAPTSTIVVNATLDGSPWSGAVSYSISGPQTSSGSSVPYSFGELAAGTYTVSYSSGGPPEATLADITPSATATLSSGDSVTITLNFRSQPSDTIMVNATLDGSPWSGTVNYNVYGPKASSGFSVPETFSSLPAGTYTVSYSSGGPPGAVLSDITPAPSQILSPGSTMTFTFNFNIQSTSTIMVNAVLDGQSWGGDVNYTIYGPKRDASSTVPDSFSDFPAGTYTISYRSGGPSGATLVNVIPSPTQTVASDDTITFTFNFNSEATGIINVNATLDGEAWSGQLNYTIDGPFTDAYSRVPYSFGNLPTGTYTVGYTSGGPSGATLVSITPKPTQSVSAGSVTTFTLNFNSQATGTIFVNATLDGSPWQTAIGSGVINYTIHGPKTDSSSSVPDTFSGLPGGTYTLSYSSGGPIGAVLSDIKPSPRQTLPPGGTITFTLNFQSQATGTVVVKATLSDEPWSGTVKYTLAGPYVDADHSVPQDFSNCPAGTYTLSYTSGGPEQMVLRNITPSPTQDLPPGGTITFTMNFIGVPVPEAESPPN
jgi:hypothetical protein